MAKQSADDKAREAATKEIEKTQVFTREELKSLQTFEDAERLFAEVGVTVDSAKDELGDGFVLLKDEAKGTLEGRPCIFISWTFSEGDFPDRITGEKGEFVSARVMTRMDNDTVGKFIINDGGTGICKQLRDYTDEHDGAHSGLFAHGGLRKSEYSNQWTDHGVTWYIDTSA